MRSMLRKWIIIVFDRIAFYLFFKYYYKLKFSNYGDNIRWGRYYYRRTIPSNVRISCPEKISIGNNCQFDEFTHLMCHHDGDGLLIGNNVRCSNGFTHITAFAKVTIEDNVLISAFCQINNGNHGFHDKNLPVMYQTYTKSGEIVIGEGSWIGRNSHVIGKVKIGKNCIIGANSVVTKDVPEYSVAVGVPANAIKRVD